MTLRFAGIVVVATGLAVLAGPLTGLWEPATNMSPGPARTALIAEGMVENVAFGIGIAVLCLGLPLFANVIPDRRRAIVAWLATVWLLVLWMPHGNLHRYVGMDTVGLVPIEWIFHVGSLVGVALLVWAVLTGRRVPAVRS